MMGLRIDRRRGDTTVLLDAAGLVLATITNLADAPLRIDAPAEVKILRGEVAHGGPRAQARREIRAKTTGRV